MKTKAVLVVMNAAFGLAFALLSSSSHAECTQYRQFCNDPQSCASMRAAWDQCRADEAAQRRAENQRRQQEYERRHQAEIDAIKKVEEGNRAVRRAGVAR